MQLEAPWSPILAFLLIIVANVGPTLTKTEDIIRSRKYLRYQPMSPHRDGLFVIPSKTVLVKRTQAGVRCANGGVGYYQGFADRQSDYAMGHDQRMPTGSGWTMSAGDSNKDGRDWIGVLGTVGLLGLIGLKSLVPPFALLLPLLPLLSILIPVLFFPLLLPPILPALLPLLSLLILLLPVPVVVIPNPGLPTDPGAITPTTTPTTPTTPVATTPSTTTTTRTPVPICGIPVGVTPPVGTACDCSATPATMVCRFGTTTDTCLCDAAGNNCACTDNTGVATLPPTCQAMRRRNRPVRGRGLSFLDPEFQHHSNNTRNGTYRWS